MRDVRLEDKGSFIKVILLSNAAHGWVNANLKVDRWKLVKGGFTCDPLDALHLASRLEADGLTVGGSVTPAPISVFLVRP